MKIERKPNFQPVVITLESQEEVIAMWRYLNGHPRSTIPANYPSTEEAFAMVRVRTTFNCDLGKEI